MDAFFSLIERYDLFELFAWLVMAILALGAGLLLVRLVHAIKNLRERD